MSNPRDAQRMMTLFHIAQELPGANRRPSGWQARIAASLYYKNELIALGWNQARTSPFQAKYGSNPDAIFIHAEVHTLKQALRRYTQDELNRMKTTLYICRAKRVPISRNRSRSIWGMSKPCPGCSGAILDFGVNRVVYSLDQEGDDQKWGEMNLSDFRYPTACDHH